ncbi:hypothetical protein [Streptomyces sp. NPDC006638]|uniref:hypothetical protein n=1 Tax=Streptomyces sp. NPDC006638 TaxID=3157183 RepID=UPI0033B1F47C
MSAPDEVVAVWTEHSRSATTSKHLLAATGGPYDPGSNVVFQNELMEERRATEAEQQRLHAQEWRVTSCGSRATKGGRPVQGL